MNKYLRTALFGFGFLFSSLQLISCSTPYQRQTSSLPVNIDPSNTLADIGIVVISAEDEKQIREGSGFNISSRFVLTAYHVAGNAKTIRINGVEAILVDCSPGDDWAILEVPNQKTKGKIYKLAEAVLGEPAWGAGYIRPLFKSIEVMTHGYVTSTNAEGKVLYNGGLQSGLSGGPLINSNGEAIGIACDILPIETMFPNTTMGRYTHTKFAKRWMNSRS